MEKATKLDEIDAALNKFQPVTPGHAFYVDFDNARGDFQGRDVMRMLNVTIEGDAYSFNHMPNKTNKTLLFLAGMRGSGKTSELAKYALLLDSPACFFVVTCNVDEELDLDNIGYMDILIFQLEKLLKKAEAADLHLNEDILKEMKKWFESSVTEINRTLKAESGAEIEMGNEKQLSIGSLFSQFLGITAKIKMGLSGSY